MTAQPKAQKLFETWWVHLFISLFVVAILRIIFSTLLYDHWNCQLETDGDCDHTLLKESIDLFPIIVVFHYFSLLISLGLVAFALAYVAEYKKWKMSRIKSSLFGAIASLGWAVSLHGIDNVAQDDRRFQIYWELGALTLAGMLGGLLYAELRIRYQRPQE